MSSQPPFQSVFHYNCYNCNFSDDQPPAQSENDEPKCRKCGSTFIEILQNSTAREAAEWFQAVTNQQQNNPNNTNQDAAETSSPQQEESNSTTSTPNATNNSQTNNLSQEDMLQELMRTVMTGNSGLPTTTNLVRQPDGSMAQQVVIDARSLNLRRFLNNNNNNNNNNNGSEGNENENEPFDPSAPPRQAIEIQTQMTGLDLLNLLGSGGGNTNNRNNRRNNNNNFDLASLLSSAIANGNVGVQAQVVEIEHDDDDDDDDEEGEEEGEEEDEWETDDDQDSDENIPVVSNSSNSRRSNNNNNVNNASNLPMGGLELGGLNLRSVQMPDGSTAIVGIGAGNAHTQRMLRRAGLFSSNNNNNNQHNNNHNSSTTASTSQRPQQQQPDPSTRTNRTNNNNSNNNQQQQRTRRNQNSILRSLAGLAGVNNIGNNIVASEADQLHHLFMQAVGSSHLGNKPTAPVVLESLPRMTADAARRRCQQIQAKSPDSNNKNKNNNNDGDNASSPNQEAPCCPVCFDEYHVADEEDANRNNHFDSDFGFSQQPSPPEKIVELPCQHLFHERCVIPWLKKNHSCPLCRAKLATDDELD